MKLHLCEWWAHLPLVQMELQRNVACTNGASQECRLHKWSCLCMPAACAARFRTGHSPAPGHNLGVGDPGLNPKVHPRVTCLYLHCAGSQGSYFLLHSVCNARIHGGASWKNVVGIEVLADVNVTFHDRIVCRLMNTSWFHACGESTRSQGHRPNSSEVSELI